MTNFMDRYGQQLLWSRVSSRRRSLARCWRAVRVVVAGRRISGWATDADVPLMATEAGRGCGRAVPVCCVPQRCCW
jgi:hypothetical protein